MRKRSGMVDDASRYLSERQVEFIIHVGSPLVVAQGAGFDLILIDRIRRAAGCEATTTIRAAIDAFARLGVHRRGLVTPFPAALNKQLTDFWMPMKSAPPVCAPWPRLHDAAGRSSAVSD